MERSLISNLTKKMLVDAYFCFIVLNCYSQEENKTKDIEKKSVVLSMKTLYRVVLPIFAVNIPKYSGLFVTHFQCESVISRYIKADLIILIHYAPQRPRKYHTGRTECPRRPGPLGAGR